MLEDALARAGGGVRSMEISGLSCDSRKVKEGDLFFALSGEKTDGLKFVSEAMGKGAAAAVAERDDTLTGLTKPILKVANPRACLSEAAANFYGQQPGIIGAVTGTAGKTSVATFLRQIWTQTGEAAASLGTTGVVSPGRQDYGNLTTPDPIALHALLAELCHDGVTHAAMEASSHGLDQYRLHGVRLAIAGFTNLGRDHLDYHASMESYLDAKLKLFCEVLPENAPAVVFADDAWSSKVGEAITSAGRNLLTVGRGGSFISLKRVEHLQFCQSVDVEHDGVTHRFTLPLAGDFQIANGLVAAGMAIATGSIPSGVFQALETLKGASGRLELVGRSASGAPAYVDYAHKPEALENVLTSVRPFTTGKIILVFGCGGDRDPGKRPVMGEIGARLADSVIVTDDNPRMEDPAKIRAAILKTAPHATEIADRAEAIHVAVGDLREGDCLIVAGKGHEPGQIIGEEVLPFSDHKVLKDALEARGGGQI